MIMPIILSQPKMEDFFLTVFWMFHCPMEAGQDGKQMHFNQRHGAGEFWCHKVDKNGDLVWRSYFGGIKQ